MGNNSSTSQNQIEYDIIICPQCDTRQEAAVSLNEGDPWWTMVHTCVKCEYVIMESEWEREGENSTAMRGAWDADPTAGELPY